MRFRFYILYFIFTVIGYAGAAQNSFTVEAPNVVGSSEAFRVVYTADGDVETFTPPAFSGADVLLGPTQSRMQSMQIINGKRSQSLEISYTYVIRPNNNKLISISQASAKIGGKNYTARALSIEVVEGDQSGTAARGQQDQQADEVQTSKNEAQSSSSGNEDIILKLNVSKTKVVKGEPIVATLKLYTNSQIVGFEDIKFPVFNGFWSQETESPQNLNFVRERLGNKIYSTAVLRKYILLPQQTGTITIEPADLVAQIQVRVNSGRRGGFFDDFFDDYQTIRRRISTSPVKIEVASLPSGAPASFGGAVGDFSMNVKFSRDSIKSNEAASLIIDIDGTGNLNLIEAPKYDFPADFEVYDVRSNNNLSNTAGGLRGKKSFEYPFIPRAVGRYVLPPIDFTYYDLKNRKYVTISSDSLRIDVGKGDNIAGGIMAQGITKQEVASLRDDIRYISAGAPMLRKGGEFFIFSPLYFVFVVSLIAFAALGWFMLKRHYALRKDVRRARSKKANKIAVKRLNIASGYLKQNLSVPFYEELHKAIVGYVADKLSIPFADLDKDNISEKLRDKGAAAEDVEMLVGILDECEMARYSGSNVEGSMGVLYEKSLALLSKLEDIL